MPAAAVGPRRSRTATALVLAGVVASCSLMSHPWGKADDYVAGLQCRMSEDELRSYTKQYAQLQIRGRSRQEVCKRASGGGLLSVVGVGVVDDADAVSVAGSEGNLG